MKHRDPLNSLRLHRGAEHLHRLGARAVAEAMAEVADKIGGWPVLLAVLAEYENRLTSAKLARTGGDRFPPKPLRRVA